MSETRDIEPATTQTHGDAAAANGATDGREVVYLAGGVALMIFGAGLVLTHPGLRRLAVTGLTGVLPELEKPLREGIAGLLPDVERYVKIRSM